MPNSGRYSLHSYPPSVYLESWCRERTSIAFRGKGVPDAGSEWATGLAIASCCARGSLVGVVRAVSHQRLASWLVAVAMPGDRGGLEVAGQPGRGRPYLAQAAASRW